jgi:hypothetical protein
MGPGAGVRVVSGPAELAGLVVVSRTGVHVGYESWAERDVLMALDADPRVEAVASQPMCLHWASEAGKPRRHAPDFFVRRTDVVGLFVCAPIDDQRQRTFVTGYPGQTAWRASCSAAR